MEGAAGPIGMPSARAPQLHLLLGQAAGTEATCTGRAAHTPVPSASAANAAWPRGRYPAQGGTAWPRGMLSGSGGCCPAQGGLPGPGGAVG